MRAQASSHDRPYKGEKRRINDVCGKARDEGYERGKREASASCSFADGYAAGAKEGLRGAYSAGYVDGYRRALADTESLNRRVLEGLLEGVKVLEP